MLLEFAFWQIVSKEHVCV